MAAFFLLGGFFALFALLLTATIFNLLPKEQRDYAAAVVSVVLGTSFSSILMGLIALLFGL